MLTAKSIARTKARLLDLNPPGSRLDRIRGRKQMERALAKDDPELEHEIRHAIRHELESRASYENEWDAGMFPEEFVGMVEAEGLMTILEYFPNAQHVQTVLQGVPTERIEAELREEVQEAADSMGPGQRRGGRPLFEFESGRGGGMGLRPVYYELRVHFDEPLSWVPQKKMLELLADEGPSGADWEAIDDDIYSSGWLEGHDYWRLAVRSDADEWATDQRQLYYSDLIDEGGDKAIAMFQTQMQEHYPDLATRIKKAKLPNDILADLAVVFFENPVDGIQVIAEAVGSFGYEGTRADEILEVDKDTLRALGITEGKWWDGAPWKLLNLPVVELAYEGTLQRHCVGRWDMGYREAVERGQIYIWSLRSRFNKPVLTFEINRFLWERANEIPGQPPDEHRGSAIVQIKGKLNRLAGQDQDGNPDPDEQAVLLWIFERLGVDPGFVSEFRYDEPLARVANPSFNAPWRPYHLRRR